jgi:hypothetical protein
MRRHVLCDVFRSICGGIQAQAPVKAARNSAFVLLWRIATLSFIIPHGLLSGVVKSGLRGGHGSGEGADQFHGQFTGLGMLD